MQMMSTENLYNKYDRLTINGRTLNGVQAIMDYCVQLKCSHSEEDKHIASFLEEWLNDESSMLLQTSGSTGEPKLITVSKRAMVASARRTIQFFDLKMGDSALLCLSAKYIAGKMMLVRALVGRLNILTVGVSSNPLKEINRNIDFVAMVPLQVSCILKENKESLELVRKLIIGGGSVHPEVEKAFYGLNTAIWETYGMTETVSHIALRRLVSGTELFRLLPGIQIVIDGRGCLCIQPSDINEELLVTNDLVELVGDDEFRLLGRYDNIINSGGIKLMPEAIEMKLKSQIKSDFAISWKSDVTLGQKVVLVVESDDSIELEQFDFTALSKYEMPKEVIALSNLPRTETGKIQRTKLNELIS